ncbi:MAG: hypothetical protein GQ570_07840 [Helicobacteraceae bacterium]|nr:hypothetical protein [Helicobacteraceae bacterium]
MKKINPLLLKDEWTQQEFLEAKKNLTKEVFLVDTILSPFEKEDSITYNPYELVNKPKGSVFVFYCDSGKATLNRLKEYKEKFKDYVCISLKGGKGYWRKNYRIEE